MFEAEVAMERRSSLLPLLLMLCLVAAIVGLATYVFLQVHEKTPLTAEQASQFAAAALRGPSPAVIHFRTGVLKPSARSDDNENPEDANYRLLEKAGIIRFDEANFSRSPRRTVRVSLTRKGETLLHAIPGVEKSNDRDGTVLYQVRLADRQLVSIAAVNMTAVNNAVVEYNWKWTPNSMGDIFDAGGPLVKSFNTWDRQTLINKYRVAFYHDNANRATLELARNGKAWKLAAQ